MAACRLFDSTFLFTGPQQTPFQSRRFSPLTPPDTYNLKWRSSSLRKLNHKQCSVSLKKSKGIRAVAIPIEPSTADSAEYRKQLCENYGFRQIGEPLPDTVTLKNIVDSLPKKVFEIDDGKALKSVLISVTSYALGLFMTSQSPWYLLPLAWVWTGTAATGFFVIGHDCAHKSFSKNKLVEDIVGTLAFLPLIYPYEPWRFKHDRHHAKTNMLIEDTAWLPIEKEELESNSILRRALVWAYGPLRPWASIAHWLVKHFNLKTFRSNEVKRVKISLGCVIAFMAVGWPLIVYQTGITGWINYWLMPWLVYHFWVQSGAFLLAGIFKLNHENYTPYSQNAIPTALCTYFRMSTFTMVHHTAPHIPFKPSNEWNAAQAQLNGTVHCDYPRWIEILCHDINVHIPHHISSKIPNYNLRAAHQSLQENWGKHMNEATWNWRLMKTILTLCHVYDKEQNYIPFDEVAPDVSQPITFLRKVMPDYA